MLMSSDLPLVTEIPSLRHSRGTKTPRSESFTLGGSARKRRKHLQRNSFNTEPEQPSKQKRHLTIIDQPELFHCSTESSNCACRTLTRIDQLFIIECGGKQEIGGCESLTQTLRYKKDFHLVRFLWKEHHSDLDLAIPRYDECSNHIIIVEGTSLDLARLKFVGWLETTATP
jgi:hypothetical protein